LHIPERKEDASAEREVSRKKEGQKSFAGMLYDLLMHNCDRDRMAYTSNL
jgi:hypothetical protein